MSFSFGASPSPAGGFGSSFSFSAPPSGASFSSSTSNPAAPSASQPGSSLPGFSTSFSQSSTTSQPGSVPPKILDVPDYEAIFPGMKISQLVQRLVQSSEQSLPGSDLAGQELVRLLSREGDTPQGTPNNIGKLLAAPEPLRVQSPNPAFRQELSTTPMLRIGGQEAPLTPAILHDVLYLADDLQISEREAISLYAQACQAPLRAHLAEVVVDPLTTTSIRLVETNANVAARELYFHERGQFLRTTLSLFHHRVAFLSGNILQATDLLLQQGLISNLINLVREYTRRADEVRIRLSRVSGKDSNASSNFVQAQLKFALAQRQVAAECLFFAAYQSQWTANEVVEFVDLIKDLTNGVDSSQGLKILDPFDDAPSAFVKISSSTTNWMHSEVPLFTSREKDPFEWQKELVDQVFQTGLPELLRCVSVLVVTVLAALNADDLLVDRDTHAPNVFGEGNALLPPGSTSSEHLKLLNSKLSKEASKEWKRTDVMGILMASYSLLLRSSPSVLASPRATPTAVPSGLDLRRAWREAMESPAAFKSFTFGRLSLIPSLQIPAPDTKAECDVAEFLVSTLSRFVAQYMDELSASGDWPLSREQWKQDEEEDLRLRRAQMEQQRQFQNWSGTRDVVEEHIPAQIDLLQRPDCLDDLLAFARSICSIGPDYSLPFWAREELAGSSGANATLTLAPSRALNDLASIRDSDSSLQASFLSFLSTLALARNEEQSLYGAARVHTMMSGPSQMVASGWVELFAVLRWYIRQLDVQGHSGSVPSRPTTSGPVQSTTSYYYSTTDGPRESSSGNPSERSSGSSGAASASKPKELGDENTFRILSQLELVRNVASYCPKARAEILDVSLPVESIDGTGTSAQDSSLMILFTLATMPVSPDIRGAVFGAISELLSPNGCDGGDVLRIRDAAKQGWQLLETSLFLPIHLLDQYQQVDFSAGFIPRVAFPQFSLAKDRNGTNGIPADSRYGILYEMEYVEASMGTYPSTMGFLQLLKSLFLAAGAPHSLGENWRARSGCSPYIEYVVHYVLPRFSAFGLNLPELKFRSPEDRTRVITLALEVALAVATQYIVPTPEALNFPERFQPDRAFLQTKSSAKACLGFDEVAETTVAKPISDDIAAFLLDFAKKPIGLRGRESVSHDLLPHAKSPGFVVLVEMLSSRGADLFNAVVRILSESSGQQQGWEADKISLADALFVATPPSFLSKKLPNASPRLSLLKPLNEHSTAVCFSSAVRWRDRATLAALRLLCVAISREAEMLLLSSNVPGESTMVPVLRFERLATQQAGLRVFDVQLSPFAPRLSRDVFSSIVSLIFGHISVEIASAAVTVLFYVDRSFLQQQRGLLQKHARAIAGAFADRLLLQRRTGSSQEYHLSLFILARLLQDLRSYSYSSDSLSSVMLGLPRETDGGNWTFGSPLPVRPKDCFDSIILLLQGPLALTHNFPSLATLCYELLYRLCEMNDGRDETIRRVLYAAERLRAVDFWKVQLYILTDGVTSDQPEHMESSFITDRTHSMAWLLRGVATELSLLSGLSMSQSTSQQYHNYLAARPPHFRALLDAVFSTTHHISQKFIAFIPLRRTTVESAPTYLAPEAVQSAKERLPGPLDITNGYEIVIAEKLMAALRAKGSITDIEFVGRWAMSWNTSIAKDCASAHLTEAIRSLLTTIHFAISSDGTDLSRSADALANTEVLNHLVDCISSWGDYGIVLDDQFYTTATRNIAHCAFVAASLIVDSNEVVPPMELVKTCGNLARAIARSGVNFQNENSRTNERTSFLALALTLMLQQEELEQSACLEWHDYVAAATVLARLSIRPLSADQPSSGSTQSMVARATLSLLLECMKPASETVGTHVDHPLLMAVLQERIESKPNTSIAEAMIRSIRALDPDICILLAEIGGLQVGGSHLLKCNVMVELETAVATQREPGSRVIARLPVAPAMVYVPPTPPCLPSHVLLMSALLTSQQGAARHKLALECLQVLCSYGDVIQPLFHNYPADLETTLSIVTCISQAIQIISSQTSSGLDKFMPSGLTALAHAGFDQSITMLAMHIAERPLPNALLVKLPHYLKQSNMAVGGEEEKSWWNALVQQNRMSLAESTNLTGELCVLGTYGARLMRTGLWIIRHLSLHSLIDARSLCRSIVRCVDAAKMIESITDQNIGVIRDEKQDWVTFHLLLRESIEELLLQVLDRFHGVKQYGSVSKVDDDDFRATLKSTIDFAQIDVRPIGFYEVDENSIDPLLLLARRIRSELGAK